MNSMIENSFYGERFNLQLKPYKGADYSKIAFVFPGQGAATPGMMKAELRKLPICLKRLEEADLFSDKKKIEKVSWYITKPDAISKKNFALIQNLALYCLEVGIFESLILQKRNPLYLTAHSFGEYAALVCAGCLDFNSMLEVIYQRELFSPRPLDIGTMIALSINKNDFESLNCPIDCVVANINSPEQIVVSLKMSHVKKMCAFLKEKRIAYRQLDSVGRPYHSPLMVKTAEQMKKWVLQSKFVLNNFKIPMLSSVNLKQYAAGSSLSLQEFAELVSQQVTNPVLFSDQILKLKELGCHSYLELGSSQLYVNFVKSILDGQDFSAQTVQSMLTAEGERASRSLEAKLNLENSPIFKTLSHYIGKVTGYDLLEIGVDDFFQEDLRIDSIKKAEIIFRTLEESNCHIDESLSLAQLRSVGEVVEYLEKIQHGPLIKKTKKKDQTDSYLTLSKAILASDVVQLPLIQKTEYEKHIVKIGKNLDQCFIGTQEFIGQSLAKKKYIVLDLDPALKDFNCLEKVSGEKSWLQQLSRKVSDVLIANEEDKYSMTICLLSVFGGPTFEALKAFFKSIAKENHYCFKSILSDDYQTLHNMIDQELNDNVIDVIYRQGQRFVEHFIPLVYGNSLCERKNIVIIGGARGLAYELFTNLKKDKTYKITVLGRSSSKSPAIEKNLKKLKACFSYFEYMQVDALDYNALNECLIQAKKKMGQIHLVINSAGIENSRLLNEKDESEIQLEAATKIIISENLLKIKKQIDFDLLHFSSVVGEFGNDGQTIYSLGNAYQASSTDCVSIMWPGMDQVGMTENVGLLQKIKSTGVSLLPLKTAVAWFESFLQKKWEVNKYFLLTAKDVMLYEFFLRDPRAYLSSVGELVSPHEMTYRKIYNMHQDSYLVDHLIETASVVPASAAMASMLTVSKLFYKKYPSLKNFEIKNIMMLVDGRDITCYANYEWDENLNISSLMTSQIEHFVAQLSLPANEELNQQNRSDKKYTQQVDLSTFYSKECIAFGPKFRALSQALYNAETGEVLGVGHPAVTYYSGQSSVDALMSVFEAAFQTVSLIGLILRKGLVIPLKIKDLKIYSLAYKQVFVEPEVLADNRGRDDLPLVANVHVYNENGAKLMTFTNLEMTSIRYHDSLPFKFQDVVIRK